MPKRSRIQLEDVATWPNLVEATWNAAKGKRHQKEVVRYVGDLEGNLTNLQRSILGGNAPVGRGTTFQIHDPKPRAIHAPIFEERILHHAIVALVGPVLDRTLVADTFACRTGKGTHAAVLRAQHHARRHDWFGKLDVRQYFATIDHHTLLRMLDRRFKDRRLKHLMARIIDAHHTEVGRGLPIGSLTSQTFANFYLNPFDRFLLEQTEATGIVRYMDDVVWWGDSKAAVLRIGREAKAFLNKELLLDSKPLHVDRCQRGISLCGFRILPGTIRLSRRRKNRYRWGRRRWEARYLRGEISKLELQSAYSSLHGMTLLADARSFRQMELERNPPMEAIECL